MSRSPEQDRKEIEDWIQIIQPYVISRSLHGERGKPSLDLQDRAFIAELPLIVAANEKLKRYFDVARPL